jgi:DNA repair protein RecO (recombination protein O)
LKQQRDEAFVLRTHPLGEADLIVSLQTQDHGKLRGVARAARKSRKRFGGLLEPLTRVKVSWSEKEGRELHQLQDFEAVRSFAQMQSDPVLQATCAVLSQLSEAFARDSEPDPRSFKLLAASLEALEQGIDPVSVVRYFEYWTLLLNGLFPDLGVCHQCDHKIESGDPLWVDEAADLFCDDCRASNSQSMTRLRRSDISFLENARHNPPGKIDQAAGPRKPGSALERLLRGRLEAFAELKFRTYRHLQSILSFPGGDS